MMRKRLAFQCWNCHRTYTLMKEITKEQELIVACPFCKAEAVVKLEPFIKPRKTVLRGDADGQAETLGYEYDFPKIINTQQPE